jgi:hypothetical protein
MSYGDDENAIRLVAIHDLERKSLDEASLVARVDEGERFWIGRDPP